MRKKLMLVAALAGILSLGACVDDKESASVEAVRNAKAKQLEALAAKYNAEAEAELILANAEKAIKEAEAAYQKALAEQEQLNADKAKELYALELEAAKADAEAAIAKAKEQATKAEQALLDAVDERIADLYIVYSNAANDLAGLNRDLLNEKINLKKLEGSLVEAEAFVKQQSVSLNHRIALNTAKVEALKALPANDKEALKAQKEKYLADLKPLQVELNVKNDAYAKASDAYSDGRDNLIMYNSSTLKLVEAAEEIRHFNNSIVAVTTYDLTDSETIYQYSLKQSVVTLTKNDLVSIVDGYTVTLGAPKTGSTSATGVYVDLEAKQTAYETAKTTYDTTPNETNRYIMEVAKAELEAYQENTVETEKKNLEDAKADLAEFNALVAAFGGDDLTAYNTALAELKTLAEAYEKADDALVEVNDKMDVIYDLLDSVNRLSAGLADLPQEIADAESEIATAKKGLANLTMVDDKETAIAYAKEMISTLENKIVAKKAILNRAKAALDAAIAE